tara:strand:+ start:457 stop:855 length:399 start_codon:yes stop_codon:yes gene_type:complete
MKLTDNTRLWSVQTEGDCEGRTVTSFGTFQGSIVDIAQRLASKAYYQLTFTEVAPQNNYPQISKIPKEVHMSVRGMRTSEVRKKLNDEGHNTGESNFYDAFTLKIPVRDIIAMKKKIALDKLTDEEKGLLGL